MSVRRGIILKKAVLIIGIIGCPIILSTSLYADTLTFQKGDGGSYSETDDATMVENTPATNYGGANRFFVRGGGWRRRNTVIKFPQIFGPNEGQIPLGSSITSATLSLYCRRPSPATVDVYRVLEAWDELECTWNNRRTGVAWSGPGCSPPSRSEALESSFVPDTIGKWYDIDITSACQAWSNGEANRGVVLIQEDPLNSDMSVFYSSDEDTETTLRPKLTVVYIPKVSLSLSNHTFSFGTQPLNTWLDAQSTIITNDGSVNENFIITLSPFITTDGKTWAIGTENGDDKCCAQWSTDAGQWNDISYYNTNFTIATNVPVGGEVTLYFKIQTPKSTQSFNEYSSTLTVTAEEY
ncbi:MAG: DNRLRE domain-containing protein [bacterium]|nr:DNRLRE domain-containing protein [bacterium]